MLTESDLYARLTWSRVRVLSALDPDMPLRDVASQLGMSLNGVRSHVRDLRALTGTGNVRGLAQWWEVNRLEWLKEMALVAGIEAEGLRSSKGDTRLSVSSAT